MGEQRVYQGQQGLMSANEDRLAALRALFASGQTRPLSFRKARLLALREAIVSRETELLEALYADLRKPAHEAYASEIGFVLSETDYALRNLSRWARPKRARTPLMVWPAEGRVYSEPYGVALIIGPWNYPLQLLLSPLVGAMAAGNCACLKPSELAPATASVVAGMMAETFPPEYVAVVEGDGDTTQRLIAGGVDYLFFTGSVNTGRKVMESAARRLTPVTLELGGKCPCIVCPDVDLDIAARRILWGKFVNAGQTCVAPDFVMVHDSIEQDLLKAFERVLTTFYGPDPRQSPDYGRIINRKHFDRLVAYLRDGSPVCGARHDAKDLYIAPTILTDVAPAAPVMCEEIFGPILPVLSFSKLDDVVTTLRERPTPLALYLFSGDDEVQRRVIAETASGGVCINDTVSHIVAKELPFGGLGASGMGRYHGKASFDCFSHRRSVLRRSLWLDPLLRYPPARSSLKALKRAYRYLLRK